LCAAVVAILEVGHVDVDDAVEQGERLQAVVAAGVVNERQAEPALSGDAQGRDDLRHDMARRDEIDVVAADRLQSQHQVGELLVARLHAFASPGNLKILAIDAAQVAPGEEDRARAARAAEAVLLAVVRPRRMDDRPLAGAADCAAGRLPPVDPAIAGAEVASAETGARFATSLGEFARAHEAEIRRLRSPAFRVGFRAFDCGQHAGRLAIGKRRRSP
jgi:hypothetical protein